MSSAQYPARIRAAAWAVHILTMSGLVWASLAMLATIHREFTWMWVWLLVALVVDGVDGTLARRAKVSEVIPWFDGSIVDIVVDYLTWTFIPAVFMYVGLDMGPKPVAGLLMALILTSSMFCYANKQWKSTDCQYHRHPCACGAYVGTHTLRPSGACEAFPHSQYRRSGLVVPGYLLAGGYLPRATSEYGCRHCCLWWVGLARRVSAFDSWCRVGHGTLYDARHRASQLRRFLAAWPKPLPNRPLNISVRTTQHNKAATDHKSRVAALSLIGVLAQPVRGACRP